MISALRAPLARRVRLEMPIWQIALYAIANAPITLVALGGTGIDWTTLADTPSSFFRGDLYVAREVPFAWSPVAALLLGLLTPLGYAGWFALHLAAIVLLRNPTLILLTLLSGGVWADAIFGNTVTFVYVAGALALQGSKTAGLISVLLFALMPRPLQLPLLGWLLWKHPTWRYPAIAIALLHGVAVLATGYSMEWLHALSSAGTTQIVPEINWGPSQLIGPIWLAIGLPLAAWLTWNRYVGLAGLAASPYILPHYAVLILWDVRLRHSTARTAVQTAPERHRFT